MNFLHPSSFSLLWLLLIPVALWLFRRKAKRVPVSTLLFFRTLAREHQESAWLRRIKKWLSLLLTLLVILLAVFALARPFHEGGGDAPRSLVVMLDRSASMAATNEKGISRLEEAKTLLKDRLRSLPDNLVSSLIIYDGEAEVVQSRTTNRRDVLRMIEQAQVAPVEDKPEEAFAVAQRLAVLDSPSEIWHVSDQPLVGKAEEMSNSKTNYRFMDVALKRAINVGITGFQIRPAPLARNRFEAFVEVSASAANEKNVETSLEVRLDGRPVQLRELELKPGENVRLILPLEGGKGQGLEIEVRAAGDVLGWDNLVLAPLPETKQLVVAWFAEAPDPFTELALTSMLAEERIQILRGGAKDWPLQEKPDVYVFENWVPKDWPADRPALVLNPPESSGPIQAKRLEKSVPYDAIRAVQPDHPLLFRVTSSRVAVTQTSLLSGRSTLETLWMAGDEPVLLAGEVDGQRLVVTAFVPGKSEQLALLSAFPLLIGNALYWCAESHDVLTSSQIHHTGDLVSTKPGLVKWRAWDGKSLSDVSEESKTDWLKLSHIGVYETSAGKAASALLASPRETNVPAHEISQAVESENSRGWATGGGWWSVLLWSALGLLLVESWLFHRHAVY